MRLRAGATILLTQKRCGVAQAAPALVILQIAVGSTKLRSLVRQMLRSVVFCEGGQSVVWIRRGWFGGS